MTPVGAISSRTDLQMTMSGSQHIPRSSQSASWRARAPSVASDGKYCILRAILVSDDSGGL
jgi:hypothetical protein